MKRFLSILLVAMLIVTSLATAAFAAGSANVSVSSIENAVPGNEYTVTFTVTGEFANYELYVKADSGLKLTGISGIVHNVNTGKVAFATDENITSHSFKATFKLDENAKCGSYKVWADVLFVSDRNLVVANVSTSAGKITVAHKWDGGKVTTEPTCEGTGVKTTTCTICGETKTETIPANGHKAGDWEVTKPATCTTAGEKVQKCTVCGKVLATETIKALDHDWVLNASKSTPATCEKDGENHYDCSRCDATKVDYVKATGHKAGDWVETKAATCTTAGEKVQKCTVCGKVLKTEVIPAAGHVDGEWTVTKEPTCTAAGEKVLKCAVCDVVIETEVIPANGHQWCENFDCEHEHEHYDEEYHWFLCLICGEKKDAERHDHCIEKGGYLFCECGHWIEIDEPGIDPEPKPGDYRFVMFAGFAALIAMMAAAAYVYKRKMAN